MRDVHLVLLIHGLWGRPAHLTEAAKELERAWDGGGEHKLEDEHKHKQSARGSSSTDRDTQSETLPKSPANGVKHANAGDGRNSSGPGDELAVVVAQGIIAKLTYDGIDVCASRVAWEVDQHVARIEASGKRVARFSILGYSLGGLVARFLVGLLEARTPSFFNAHTPVAFTTIATPHLGIPRYNTVLSTALTWLGGRLLSRSGEQLYTVDTYSANDPRPLLEIMADPGHIFHHALGRFAKLHIYANLVNDHTVPYPSAAISLTDPFTEWSERGLTVHADADHFVTGWSFPKRPPTPRKAWRVGSLPNALKFKWPFSWLVIILFPIIMPLIIVLTLFRLGLDTRSSRLRVLRLAKGDTASPEEASPIPSALGLSIDDLRDAVKAVERGLEQDMMEAVEEGWEEESYEQREEEEQDDEGEEREIRNVQHVQQGDMRQRKGKRAGAKSERWDEDEDEDSDSEAEVDDTLLLTKVAHPEHESNNTPEGEVRVLLTDAQRRMVRWLDSLPLQRHLAFFPEVANSHAVIVVRDPGRIAAHEMGRGVVLHWARRIVAAAGEAEAAASG